MTHAETIAFLKGMAAVIDGVPTQKQWDDIKVALNVKIENKDKQQPTPAPKRKHNV